MTIDYLTNAHIRVRYKGRRFFKCQPQYLDIKQMVDTEERFRRRCREAILRYRQWKHACRRQHDQMERHYQFLEGTLLRHQAEDAARLYALIRRDVRKNVADYIRRAG